MVRSPCPVCGTPSPTLPVPLLPVRLARCGECGHRFADALESTDHLYGHDYAGFREDPVFVANLRRLFAEELAQELPARARVLDVGCGNGTMLAVAGEFGHDALGIDASESAVARCTAQGRRAVVGDFPTHGFPAGTLFDLITFWDVLEHLRDPGAFVDRAAALLAPGGRLVAKVPGHGDLSVLVGGLVPRLAGPVLQVPGHLQFFTRTSLARLLGRGLPRHRWIDHRGMRSAASGGSVRRRLARAVVSGIHALSGDAGLLVVASRD